MRAFVLSFFSPLRGLFVLSPFLLLAIPGLVPGVSAAQAVPRTDTPRGGTLRVTFDAVVSAWDNEFTAAGKRPDGDHRGEGPPGDR